MNNNKFLNKVAAVLHGRSKSDLLQTVVVFPNKRPEIFLKKYLKEQVVQPFWIPDVRSIDEFITELSPFTIQDSMVSWFELFEIHKKLEGEKSRQPDEFINWAPIMLRDFNDADMALVDVNDLFTFLSKAKAIERWHPDGTPLTDFEKAYLDFYKSLYRYYDLFKKSLTERGMATKGMMYRAIAENIDKEEELPWKQFVFAGFNALTRAEEKLIDGLRKKYAVTLLWDVDDYYIHPKKYNLPRQEAGKPLNRIFKNLKINQPQWIENNLLEGEKNITEVAAPGQVAQVKYVGQLLEKMADANGDESPEDTAVVLADEKLLVPLLTSLNKDKAIYNVTMGYPLELGSLTQFFILWLELLVRQSEQKSRFFATALILSMLQNAALQQLIQSSGAAILKIKQFNREFLERNKVVNAFSGDDQLLSSILFPQTVDVESVFNGMMELLAKIKSHVDSTLESNGKKGLCNPILQQEVSALLVVMKKLSSILKGNETVFNLKVFQKLFVRLVSASEINLKGEPLNGVQVMGMLETRLLDFKRLVILSANEGMLPKSGGADSFIPFDIRREFGLPLPDEENAIYAYHFFRLLQRAQEVVLVYNSQEGNFGAGEKSRFLFQLEIETAKVNPNINLQHHYLKIDTGNPPAEHAIEITKSETVLKKLEALRIEGLSPSALNQYINCPLQFYFSRILKLKIPDEVKSNLEADVFGTIVHEVLEHIFTQFLNKNINVSQLKVAISTLDEQVNESLKKNFPGDVHHGKNILTMQVLKKVLERFLNREIENLQNEPRTMVAVEKELQHTLVLDNGQTVLIKGVIDRIDKQGSQVRISDYKTGSVTKNDVNFKEWHQLLTDRKYSKAFQTLTYGWLFKQNFPETKNLSVGLFSLRNLSEGFISPAALSENPDSWHLDFEATLKTLLTEIFDGNKSFCQTADTANCTYCDFKTICNK